MTPPKPKAMQDSITVTREHPDCKPITAGFATSSMTSRTPHQNLNTEGHRLNLMENDIKEIKAAVKEAMAAKPTTYAQAAAATTMGTSEPARRQNIEAAKKERQEMIKQEKGKKEVVLTARNASENMKKQVEIMQEAEAAKVVKEEPDRS